MTTPFISTADLGAMLGEDVTTSDLATIAIDAACETVRSHLDLHLNYVTDEVVALDGSGTRGLRAPNAPIVDISELSITGWGAEDLEAEDFTVNYQAGVIYREWPDIWPIGHRNVSLTYSHGYAVAESDVEDDPTDTTPKPDRMPSDIRQVALQLAATIHSASLIGAGGVTSETIGNYSYTLSEGSMGAGGLTEAQRYLLAPYRRPAFA